MRRVWIGCSGWSYRDWKGGLYRGVPASGWLERYAEVFDTVEINATFYRLPKRQTVEAWVEQTPDGFLFAVKGSRYLTHMRRLRDIDAGVARFWEPLEPLREAGRLGPVLWQLPENFVRDDELLEKALDALPPARHCFEFRHPSWFAPAVRRLLEQRGASLAIGDDARRGLPSASPVGDLAYLRLHYGSRGRDGNYSSAELDRWRRRIAAWRSRREVFVYLNNDWRGFAPANARELRRGLSPSATAS
ncbi:MAG TPA: DUF72 domain-containing protein [Solirubrobacterales bacterium]|jgi:uncharacterized protein YecE (DUF72 family)|nr:DUF72 domain-containing protein [Solirubrobacterales bacterium]